MSMFKRRTIVAGPTATQALAFCEPVHATPTSRIHVREVGEEGLKQGGGIQSAALCGYDVAKGWDLPGAVSVGRMALGLDAETGPTCPDCFAAVRALVAQ